MELLLVGFLYGDIIIMSCRQHGYPWPSLATSPYHSSPPTGLQGYILCPHIVAVCKFELVILLLHGHMWGSIGVHHLWARPCFSSSVPRAWFVSMAVFILIYRSHPYRWAAVVPRSNWQSWALRYGDIVNLLLLVEFVSTSRKRIFFINVEFSGKV